MVILLFYFVAINCCLHSSWANEDTFCYFAYGSNLLSDRIHINNPTATRIAPGKLQNYRLDFNGHSTRWNGSPATIVPTNDSSKVYGALWNIHLSNLNALDEQESVSKGIYFATNVSVSLPNGHSRICRTYLLVDQPKTVLSDNNQPSETYLKTIIKGAIETEMPENYIDFLKCIQHNGRNVKELEMKLNIQNFAFSCPKYVKIKSI